MCFSNKEDILYEVSKPKFEKNLLLENVRRIKQFVPKGSTVGRMKKSYSDIIAWREPARTVKYFVFYMFFIYYFSLYWVPLFLLYTLYINWRTSRGRLTRKEEVKYFNILLIFCKCRPPPGNPSEQVGHRG